MAAKQKLHFTINEKNFYYEGHPENRQKDLLEFIAKMKDRVPEDNYVSTFRVNFDEHEGIADEDIINKVKEIIEKKERKKAAKAAAAATTDEDPAATATKNPESPKHVDPAPPAEPEPKKDTPPASPAEPEKPAAAPKQPQQQPQQQQPNPERAKLEDFINSVIAEGSPKNMREEVESARQTQQQQEKTPQQSAAAKAATGSPSGQEMAMSASQNLGGKVSVLLAQPGVEAVKMLLVNSDTTFDAFRTLVEKKFGGNVSLRFEFTHDDDLIELDDDDSLMLFLQLEKRKYRLNCTPKTKRTDDNFTAVTGHESGDAATSNAAQLKKALDEAAAVDSTKKSGSAAPGPAALGSACHKEVKTFQGHTEAVYSCAFSPNGERFASASRDKSVRVWNVRDGESKLMKDGHDGLVLSCDFSPTADFVVSSSDDKTIKLWNASTGSKISTMRGHKDKVYCTQFNSLGNFILSASCDHHVRVWNAETQAKQETLKGHELAVFSASFSNTDAGKHIVSASDDRSVRIWDWRQKKEIRNLQGHTGTVWSCKFSNSDDYIVSASMDHEIKIWDVKAGACLHTLTGHMTPIHHAVFTNDDKHILSCARDWTVMAWNAKSGSHVDTLSGHINTVYHMDLLQNQLLTCSLDTTIRLWNLNLPK